MKRSTSYKLICLLALIFATSASCASPSKAPKAVKTVAFITNATSDFWKIAHKGCEKADAELPDVAVAFKSTNTGSAKEQNGLITDALDIDTDAIAISVIDPVGQKQVINDAAKKALVITQDSDAPDSDRALTWAPTIVPLDARPENSSRKLYHKVERSWSSSASARYKMRGNDSTA